MSIIIEPDLTMKIVQGDTGAFTIPNIPEDANYFVYFEIRDRNGRKVGKDLMVESLFRPRVTFFMDAALSDKLKVPVGHSFDIYYYGIKLCNPDTHAEETVTLSSNYGDRHRICVYPKQVEGFESSGYPNPVDVDIEPCDYRRHHNQKADFSRLVTKTDFKIVMKHTEGEIKDIRDLVNTSLYFDVIGEDNINQED